MASVLNQAYFHDEAAAFAALEKIMWPQGPVCGHCGVVGRAGRLEGVRSKPSKKHPEGVVRHGLYKCYACRGQFTVRKGTVFEASHLQLHQWFQAAFLMCSSKKGVSANQLHRTLGCTLKTAWFAAHRLREAMRDGLLPPMGGEGEVIEADETYIGRRPGHAVTTGGSHKIAVLALVERKGRVRSFKLGKVTKKGVHAHLRANVDPKSTLYTDEAKWYERDTGMKHSAVNHSSKQYVKGDVHTNTIEGVFSIFKRGMIGTYQHCGEQHLHRYLAEFDFRYNNRVALGVDDSTRTIKALSGARGKRLMYMDSR